MDDDGTPILVCVKVDDLGVPEPGSVLSVCQECEAQIWVSQNGMNFIAKNPKVYMACVTCALDRPDLDPRRTRVVPGAPRWMRRWFKRDKEAILQTLKVKDLDESE